MAMTTKVSIVNGMIRKREPQSQHSAPHLPQGSYGSPPSFRPFQKAQRARHLKMIVGMNERGLHIWETSFASDVTLFIPA